MTDVGTPSNIHIISRSAVSSRPRRSAMIAVTSARRTATPGSITQRSPSAPFLLDRVVIEQISHARVLRLARPRIHARRLANGARLVGDLLKNGSGVGAGSELVGGCSRHQNKPEQRRQGPHDRFGPLRVVMEQLKRRVLRIGLPDVKRVVVSLVALARGLPMSDLLRVAKAAGWLPAGLGLEENWDHRRAKVGDYAEVVRQIRNLIHPARYLEDNRGKWVTAKHLHLQFDVVLACVNWLAEHSKNFIRESMHREKAV
jgi:hypothetical protein